MCLKVPSGHCHHGNIVELAKYEFLSDFDAILSENDEKYQNVINFKNVFLSVKMLF